MTISDNVPRSARCGKLSVAQDMFEGYDEACQYENGDYRCGESKGYHRTVADLVEEMCEVF